MAQPTKNAELTIKLPTPENTPGMSLVECMAKRRSVRDFSQDALSLMQLSQLLWAAQGVTGYADHKRTPPSAGALHPLETYVAVGNVDRLAPGLYHYDPKDHSIAQVLNSDIRAALGQAALSQNWLADAAVSVIFSAVFDRTTRKYGRRGIRYVHMDSGFAAENLHLQAVALGMGTVVIGAFDDDEVSQVLRLPTSEQPLLILPIGWEQA